MSKKPHVFKLEEPIANAVKEILTALNEIGGRGITQEELARALLSSQVRWSILDAISDMQLQKDLKAKREAARRAS